jgi:predicted PhzF superfamily epimerase YddE/YHI9
MLWATFRVQDFMAKYVVLNFVGHPTVGSGYVKILATNSGFDKVDKIGIQMGSLRAENKTLIADLKRAQTKADTASSKLVELKSVVDLLLKRVAKVESKV